MIHCDLMIGPPHTQVGRVLVWHCAARVAHRARAHPACSSYPIPSSHLLFAPHSPSSLLLGLVPIDHDRPPNKVSLTSRCGGSGSREVTPASTGAADGAGALRPWQTSK
ncbi:unnamed protein product [Closterium sp. NIES-53]